MILMTQRRRLDAHLAEQAVAAGAELPRQRAGSTRSRSAPTASRRPSAAIACAPTSLVGADGANGIVAKAVGLGREIVRGVALEGNVAWEHLDPDRYRGRRRGRARASSGRVRLGVPEGRPREPRRRRLGQRGPRLRDHLGRLAARYGVDPTRSPTSRATGCRCGRVGARAGRGPRAPRRRRGRSRRPALGRRDLRGFRLGAARRGGDPRRPSGRYPGGLAQALDHHAAASWAAKRALDRYPAVCFWAARWPGVFGVVAGLLAGEVRHPDEARGIARPPLRLLARLARAIDPTAPKR